MSVTSEFAATFDVGASKLGYGIVGPDGLLMHNEILTPKGDETRLTDRERTNYFLEAMGEVTLGLIEDYPDVHTAAVGFNGATVYRDNEAHVGALYTITPERFPLGERLTQVVPRLAEHGMQILALGDVEAAAYGSLDYAKRKVKPGEAVMYLNLGTGFNGEVIIDGRSMRSNGHPAEWGNSIYELPNGRYISWGSLLSGGGLAVREGRSTKELYEDEDSDEFWQQVAKDLSNYVAIQLPVVGGDHIVVGGGVSVCHRRFNNWLVEDLTDRLSVLSEDCGSRTAPPEITYVPEEDLHTIALRGAYYALQGRRDELVTVQLEPDLAPLVPAQQGRC